ncbi:U5 small nuclear ribonucleoprotein [Cucumispora dikerogammari]|nr:U5 small nuclear ribonucleoprotein [Cucumispora dikerogammari]
MKEEDDTYLKWLHALLNLPLSQTELELVLINISYEQPVKENIKSFVGEANLELAILAIEETLNRNKCKNEIFETEFRNFNFRNTDKKLGMKLQILSTHPKIQTSEMTKVRPLPKDITKFSSSDSKQLNLKKKTGTLSQKNLLQTRENIHHQAYTGPFKNQHYGFNSETFINHVPSLKEQTKQTGFFKEIFGFDTFNYIQTSMLSVCLNAEQNFVVSAPTGMGKSEIALLCVIKSLIPGVSYFRETFSLPKYINRSLYRIVYLVPMKALASQTVGYLRNRLNIINATKTNLIIEEYTGDTDYLPSANILVCTPEKFEFFLIKHPKKVEAINLIIFDEIHILGSKRGVCIERIMYFLLEQKSRIVALSATINNLKDLSEFIRGKEYKFTKKDIPVDITYLSVETPFQRQLTLCNLLYNYLNQNISILLFVNKRKDCEHLAYLFLSFLEKNALYLDMPSVSDGTFKSYENIYLRGIGIHNSKLSKKHRFKTEELFRLNKIKLLISTSTLAWGVNLPAQIVILHGLTYFDSLGKKTEYDIKDILQCLGRAGRRGISETKSFSNSYLEIGNEYGILKKKDIKLKPKNKEATTTNGELRSARKNRSINDKTDLLDKLNAAPKKILNNDPIRDSSAHCFIFGDKKQLEKYKPQNFNNILLESYLLTSFADSLLGFIEKETAFESLRAFFDTTYLKIRMLRKPELYGILKVNGNKYENIYDVFKEYLILSCKELEKNFCILINHQLCSGIAKEIYTKTKYGRVASLYKINHTTIGNLVKISHRNPQTLEKPLNFVLFLIQNYEFLEMEKISINKVGLRKFHLEITQLPKYILIEEEWDVDFSEDLNMYHNLDMLMSSKYKQFVKASEDEEFSQLFIKCIILIQLIKHKGGVKAYDFLIYIDFFDKIIGRIVSGLVELEEFQTKGILFWYDLLNYKNEKSLKEFFI